MGSLNGDVMVIRNGRSTSQVSVYNYPEHLNPFYEDEQHKRLRFWKISKKDNEGRRNSFSFGNLRDMWAFKTFRLKKKSSTLGITKTSESPPPLRRELVVDNGWNTFDHRLRDSTTSSINGDSFQRNANYRSSLQNVQTNNGRMGFNRNDDYRNTIQVPRPNPRYRPQQKVPSAALRSSQSSVVSTNPFDSDEDEDNADASTLDRLNSSSTSTLSKSTQRKKRRAPAPPTPIHGRTPTIHIDSSQSNAQSDDLCIREDMDIAHLTAEIESFVKDKSNEDIETIVKTNNNNNQHDVTTKSNASNVATTEHRNETTPVAVQAMEVIPPLPPKELKKNKNTTDIKISTSASNKSDIETRSVTKDVGASSEEHREVSHIKSINSTASQVPQTNGPVKTEIVTVKTIASSKVTDNTMPANDPTSTVIVTETVVKPEVCREIKSNGAIPKKINNASEHNQPHQAANPDLCIKENNEEPQRPVPVKRVSKPDIEAGNVECIHVHVGSPKPSPRQGHSNSLSSFKQEQSSETTGVITTKTPFTLTSPPTQRKSVQSPEVSEQPINARVEPKAATSHELNITEDQVKVKPEIKPKPPLSPKPAVERNTKDHSFAEIHKPMRAKVPQSANGHVRRASREETAPLPPMVPQNQSDEAQKALENAVAPNIHAEQSKTESLKIVEIPAFKAKEQRNETRTISPPPSVSAVAETSGTNGNVECESLYRPKPQSHMEWKRSTLAPLETHIPPEKRKSVKDIIESINRSQRLLHASANKDFTIVTGPTVTAENPPSHDESLRILDESQREIRRMVQQIEHLDGADTSNGSASSAPPSYSECVEAQKLDNGEIFQKCKVQKEVYDYRETSPITSNLDWNPVPKPKRTKPHNEQE